MWLVEPDKILILWIVLMNFWLELSFWCLGFGGFGFGWRRVFYVVLFIRFYAPLVLMVGWKRSLCVGIPGPTLSYIRCWWFLFLFGWWRDLMCRHPWPDCCSFLLGFCGFYSWLVLLVWGVGVRASLARLFTIFSRLLSLAPQSVSDAGHKGKSLTQHWRWPLTTGILNPTQVRLQGMNIELFLLGVLMFQKPFAMAIL